jgi:DNA polymerase I
MAKKTSQKKTFVVIDGHAIIHRAYHAIPGLSTKDGTIVNAVFGFASMLLKVYEQFKPDYLAVSFDVPGGTFRDEIYTEYKATRKKADQDLYDQIPLIYELVEAFDIPIYEMAGYEADDVIGTIAEEIKKTYGEDVKTVIGTGDGDMLQLVDDDHTEVYLLRRGFSDMKLYDSAAVAEKFGFGPEHVIDYKAFRGDSSDNIPGVRGIGEKTATTLITNFGDIDNIYKLLEDETSEIYNVLKKGALAKLKDGKDNAYMSADLATIRRDVKDIGLDVEACDAYTLDVPRVTDLLKSYEFYSLLKRVPGAKEVAAEKEKAPKKKSKIKIENIETSSDVTKLIEEIENQKQFFCRELIEGNALTGTLAGLVFLVNKKTYFANLKSLGKEDAEKLFSLFTNNELQLIGHDLKQLVKIFKRQKVTTTNKLFDVMVASYLVNSSTRAHDLPSILMRELDEDLPEKTNQTTLFGADPTHIAEELVGIQEIYKQYDKQLEEDDNHGLFEKIEMALIPVLAQMELYGIAVDTEKLSTLSELAHKEIEETVSEIHNLAGEEFNVSSSVQLRTILFEKLELPTKGIKKGKTGFSTAASELEKLFDEHEIISWIAKYREVEKLRNTYIDVLPKLINPGTGRIHTSYNQTVASTGRLSSSDPNLQNIPIRTELGREIRDTFIAEEGYTLIAADYSQIELRIVASLAKDKELIRIFENGEDVHKATAAAIQGVDLKDVTKQMRSEAKAVNFGVLYGMGAHGLSIRTGLTHYEAREFIEKYFEAFSGVKKYLEQTTEYATEEGYVETLFGRRRYVPELESNNYQIRAAGERMAINMPVQGTAADIMKIAMIDVQNHIEEKYKDDDVRQLLQVHDELVLEVKEGLEKKVGREVRKIMEDVVKLNVPVKVHVGINKRWGQIK